ncbi:MAG TPA: ABC transporter substrate-binding protein, partial [Thermoanaerobaculia bacterium]|nr:ABC transporter substrate-binding protein [Thermoanaerobaculia bacterium]
TGPYLLDAHEPGKRLALRAFSRYWRGRAPEERVELLVVPDPGERVAALLSGRADLVQDIEAKAIDRIRAAGAYRVLGSESLLVEYLQFRLDAPPFSDLRVRRAVHLAIDREALVQQQLRGQGVAVGQMVGRQVFGYAPGISPPRRDLETARRLLAEAGYAGGFDVDLEFRASRDPGSLVEQLGEAGIRVRTVARPWEEMYRRLTGNQVDFYLGGLLAISADASDLFDSKVHSRDSARGYGDTNHTGYANAALDALIESSGATLNMLERRQLMQRSMQLLMEDLPLVPLYVPFDLYAVRDGVEWTPRLDGLVLAREMRRREGRWR